LRRSRREARADSEWRRKRAPSGEASDPNPPATRRIRARHWRPMERPKRPVGCNVAEADSQPTQAKRMRHLVLRSDCRCRQDGRPTAGRKAAGTAKKSRPQEEEGLRKSFLVVFAQGENQEKHQRVQPRGPHPDVLAPGMSGQGQNPSIYFRHTPNPLRLTRTSGAP